MRFWRFFFGFAGLYNLVIGAGMLFGSHAIAAQLGLSAGAELYFIEFIGMMIAVFGVAYLRVAADPPAGRGLVFIGLLGKLGAAALTTAHQHDLPPSTVALGLSDIPFALLFLIFLLRGPREAR